MAKDTSKNQPPYVSLGVFERAIEQLAESTVPTGPLDRRVLSDLSGADHGALISGLRFLGLVDDERQATKEYKDLVHASKNENEFKSALHRIISEKYAPIIGNLDLKTGTGAQLEKAFKDFGVAQGQMLTKTTRFFTKALKRCGFQVSPFILKAKPRTPRTNGGKNGAEKVRARAKETPIVKTDVPIEIPQGFDRMPLPGVTGAFIQYPMNLTDAQCDLLESVVGVLRAYAKAHSGGKEKRT